MIYSLLIINKAGGLIYNREYNEGITRRSSNDYLVLAGTFHGVHAITAQISPVPNSSGLEVLETETFRLQCFQTHTYPSPHLAFPPFSPQTLLAIDSTYPRVLTASGTKFLLITEPRQPNVDVVLRRIYELYADYVMKNPFYQLEMPIRCEEFDRNLAAYAKSIP